MKEKFVILKNLRMSFQKSKNVGLSVYKKIFLEKTKTHKTENKKLNLPYVYKKIGNDYYYADPKILDIEIPTGTWYKVTDQTNKDYLSKEIFPQFK